jgi:hypothetical protein
MFLVVFAVLGCPKAPEITPVVEDDGGAATPPASMPPTGGAVADAGGTPGEAGAAPAAPPAAGCPAGARRCPDGSCRANDVKACGAMCQPCAAAPANAVATCDGMQCGLTCPKDLVACDNKCVSRQEPSCCDQDAKLDADANGVPDCQENLIANAQFTRDLGLWVNGFAAYGESKWIDRDSRGSKDSGSLSVTTTPLVLSYSGTAVMGVNLPGGTYNVSVDYFIPFGQSNGGQAVLQVATQDPLVVPVVVPLGNKVGTWVTVSTFVSLDPRVQTRVLYLQADRGQAVTPFTVYFDNIVVRPLVVM